MMVVDLITLSLQVLVAGIPVFGETSLVSHLESLAVLMLYHFHSIAESLEAFMLYHFDPISEVLVDVLTS